MQVFHQLYVMQWSHVPVLLFKDILAANAHGLLSDNGHPAGAVWLYRSQEQMLLSAKNFADVSTAACFKLMAWY